MVLCPYFLTNSCRFGSKCHNDHLDIRATIKQEMEAAIKGHIYPLSVFGPFKEKANLIPDECDLSFEECRIQFLESQATNTFHIYQQQLMQKIQEANNRMQSLLNVNKDVLQMAVNIYNSNENTNPSTGQSAFGSNNATSIFGGGNVNKVTSIFGGSTNTPMTPQQTQNAASIFGGGQTSSMQNNATSIFGGGNQSSNLFGMSTNQNTSSIFGGGTNTQSTSSIFGQSNMNQQNTNSIFGGASTFGAQQSQQSIFSKPAAPAFGSSAFGAATAPTVSSGLFGNAASSTFGAGMQQSTQQSSPFSNPFGAQVNQPPQQQQQQPTGGSIFGNLGQQAAQAALASVTNQMTTQPIQASHFGSQQPPPPAFGSTNVQTNVIQTPVQHDPTIYSKMEDLSQEHLAAFQAEEFVLGKIPNVPPPKELC